LRFKKLLLVLPILALCLVMMKPASAVVDPNAKMIIKAPSSVQDTTHQTFKVNITVTNVTAMWGWSCVVTWSSSVVNCTGKQIGPFSPTGGTLLGSIDNVGGTIPKLAYGTTEDNTTTGSGIICFLTFKTIALGNASLKVSTANYINYPDLTKYDFSSVTQAPIIVIPEFPTFLIIPLFFITTAAIAIMKKKRSMKKY